MEHFAAVTHPSELQLHVPPHEGGASSVRHEALQLLERVLHDDKTRGSSTRLDGMT